jgi:hypothetical protein
MSLRYSIFSLVFLLPACRAEFDVSRSELGPFRIAALGVEDIGAECPVAKAAIWSGEGVFHSQAAQLTWTLDGEAIGDGWNVAVCGPGMLGLVAVHPDGTQREAQVDVRLRSEPLSFQRESVVLSDLDLNARREVEGEPVRATVLEGEVVRIQMEGLVEGDSVSWMSPSDQAHVLGLNESTTDLVMETWTLDDEGLLAERTPESGSSTHLALVFDGIGGNSFMWIDAVYGAEDADYLRHQGHLIYAPDMVGASFVSAWVNVDEKGWSLENISLANEGDPNLANCSNGASHFSLDWIANGRCPLDDLAGSQILLEVW